MVTVLVVDDERNLLELVEGCLKTEGFTVATAMAGPSAVETARQIRPDLIVLDVMLPGFDGVEVCRRIRQFSDAYVQMLTARGEEMDKVVGLAVGADDYVTKPFSPRELVARVKARPRSGRAEQDELPPTHRGRPSTTHVSGGRTATLAGDSSGISGRGSGPAPMRMMGAMCA